jgi:hypothetical protein
MKEMSWNKWKIASGSLRPHFYRSLVGNLRPDLKGTAPFVRTIRDPFGQLASEVLGGKATTRQVHPAVHLFQEADHFDLTVKTLSLQPNGALEAGRPGLHDA